MYNELYKAWKAERSSKTPQPLPEGFYERGSRYLASLDEEGRSLDLRTVEGRLLSREKEIANRLLRELKEIRLRKIMNAVQNGGSIPPSDLDGDEKTLYETLISSLSSLPGKADRATKAGGRPEMKPELEVIRFLKDSEAIVGVDLKFYGPYKAEDVASLPKENAEAFIKQNVAKPVEVNAPIRNK